MIEQFDLTLFDPRLLNEGILSHELIHKYQVLPLYKHADTLLIGMIDTQDLCALTAIRFHTGLNVQALTVDEKQLRELIQLHCPRTILNAQLASNLAQIKPLAENVVPLEIQFDEPISELIERLILDAMTKNISDIHIESFADYCRIRCRRDGLLEEILRVAPHLGARLIVRLKIMAQLDIAERRLPQDGRIEWHIHKHLDIRVSSCPTQYHEKVVLRLLNNQSVPLQLDALGFTNTQYQCVLETLSAPNGLILIAGPTGSGKTLTLYTLLNYLNHIEKNICTVEDPIEISLEGINQVNIQPKIGLNFATVLRSFLRQDPDIIMVGEIRDTETAKITWHAAHTGHFVLSSLHANNAREALDRLHHLAIPKIDLLSSQTLIIAQRLVRKLCARCKQLASNKTYTAGGCAHCHHGYQGRIGLFEILKCTTTKTLSLFDGMNLWQAGLAKVQHGLTTYKEIQRTLGDGLVSV